MYWMHFHLCWPYHLVECCGTAHIFKKGILDACRGVGKLMTLEEIYIKNLKQQLNTRNEYRGREMILNLCSN